MEINKNLIYRNLHFLAIEQLAEEYTEKGYKVEKDSKIGKFQADLIAIKDDEKIVIEVKAGRMDSSRKEQLAKLADHINSLGGYKFKVVIATPPKEKNIQISEFDDMIFDYLINELPDDLDELSTHTTIETVSDVEIHDLIIHRENDINVIGQGVVEVRLQFGSVGDARRGDGHFQYDSFSFDFDLYLSYGSEGKLKINEDASINVDTDSYY